MCHSSTLIGWLEGILTTVKSSQVSEILKLMKDFISVLYSLVLVYHLTWWSIRSSSLQSSSSFPLVNMLCWLAMAYLRYGLMQLFAAKLGLLSTFVCYSHLFSFHMNHPALLFRGKFRFEVCLLYASSAAWSKRRWHTHLSWHYEICLSWHAESAPTVNWWCPWCLFRANNPGCSVTGSLSWSEFCLKVQKMVSCFLSWTFPLSVWNGSFVTCFEIHFPFSLHRKYSQLFRFTSCF